MARKFGLPSIEEMDAIASKHGWYTSTEHPPLPFLAIVSDNPEDLEDCEDDASYLPFFNLTESKLKFQKGYRTTRVVFEITSDSERGGAFQLHNFARAYRGPLNIASELPANMEIGYDSTKKIGR